MKNSIVALIGVAGLATAAFGQAGWRIDPPNPTVDPNNPSVVLSISAFFSAPDYAFGAALFGVHASEAGFEAGSNIVKLPPPANPGVNDGQNVTGITAGQVHFPPVVFASPDNPIKVFNVKWSTNDFTARDVQITTRTTRFDVYIDRNSPASQPRIQGLLEGSATIKVIPAPSALALLGLGALAAGRRRR